MPDFKTKQRKFLMSKAQTLKPIMQVGKLGVSETVMEQLVDIIDKRELIKISLLQNTMIEPKEFVEATLEYDPAIKLVQIIGSKIIFFKKSPKESFRKISLEVEKLK